MEKIKIISGKDSSVLEEIVKKNDCEKKSTYEFTSDNKFISKIFVIDNGNCIEDGSETRGYSYNKNDKTLAIDSENESASVKILTSNSLIFEAPEGDFDNDGVKDFSISHFIK